MIKALLIATLVTSLILILLEGRYILRLKHHLYIKHHNLYMELRFYSPGILIGPLLGMGDSRAFIFRDQHKRYNDPAINKLCANIKRYSVTSKLGIILFIVLAVVNAFYFS